MIENVAMKRSQMSSIRVKRSSINFVYLELFYVLIVFFLRDVTGLPSAITYITDILMVGGFLMCLGRIRRSVEKGRARTQIRIIAAILIAICISSLINFVNPVHFIWGFRNNFRFFIFWLSCVVLLEKEDVNKILKLFNKFFWLNIIIISIQYFYFDIKQDFLGGLFGTARGCNAYAIILCCIILCYNASRYFSSQLSLTKFLFYCVAVFYWAALAELKVLYVEAVVIVVVAILFQKPSIKTMSLMCAVGIAVVIGYYLLLKVFPGAAEMLFDIDSLDRYLSGDGYTSSGDLNRFTAVFEIQSMFFSRDIFHTLFGFGLGSCDMASFDFLVSDFFRQYGYLNYRWFTHAWVYLEQGAIGLGLLLLFILSIFFHCFRKRKSMNRKYYLITALFTVTVLIGVIYNSALELEASYMIAFMLAIPFIINKKQTANREQKKQ